MVNLDEAPDSALINSTQLRQLFPVSAMSIWRWQRNEGFPAPMKINGRSYWTLGHVRAWIAERRTTSADVA